MSMTRAPSVEIGTEHSSPSMLFPPRSPFDFRPPAPSPMHDLPASDDPAGEEVYERRVDALRGHPNKGRETHNRPAPSPVPCENRRRRVSGHHEFARATAVKAVRGSRVTAGRALDPKELCSLFAVCDANRPDGTRNAAVLSLLYAAALRRSEVVALDLADFDSASGCLRVHGKGNKQRTVYLSNGGLLAARAWLQHRGDEPGPLIHPIRKGGTIIRRRMDDQSVLDLVRRLALAAKVQRFSPHDLRRTAVGDLLDSGVDLATAQKIAGHASPVTTSTSYDRRGEKTKMRAAALLHVPFIAADPGGAAGGGVARHGGRPASRSGFVEHAP
jgi:integrase